MSNSSVSSITVLEHYRSLLAEHGDCAQAVQYSDHDSHVARFNVLCGIASSLGSVLDVGCGLAHLYRHLRSTGFSGRYCGVDIVPEFVALANQHMRTDDRACAVTRDGSEELPIGYDYVLLSGVFNNIMPDNRQFMEATLRRMFAAADKGIAFNAMSTYVDYRDDGLFYIDPLEVLHFCKRELGGHPVLRHDYALSENGFPFEFAVYVYKEPRNV